ncbi:protein-tyrosine phosphatase [Rhizophagus irregularis DAOM 181602=DAOM 197198]|nr:protein-tyrosine phosphatase [Rhizophagus irregularis DAOM 181602=DAOM 197198]
MIFAIVEDEVYRGAYPKNRNYRFLKRLKLKTMLSLVPDPPVPELLEFCQNENIKNIHFHVRKVKDNVPLNYNKVVQLIQIIIDPSSLPVFVHCLDGANVTGLVIACLRKLQMWNISSAMGEFLRYLRGGVISSEESEFVEKFSAEIEIPCTIPTWLWGGHVTFNKHPTLKLKFLDPNMVEQQEQQKKKSGFHVVEVVEKRVGANLLENLLESSDKVTTDYDKRDEATEADVKVSRTLQALALEGLDY